MSGDYSRSDDALHVEDEDNNDITPRQRRRYSSVPNTASCSLPDLSGRPPVAVGRLTPLKPLTLKEMEDNLGHLRKENFNLKLRIFHLEQRLGNISKFNGEDVHKMNIDLQLALDSCRRENDATSVQLKQALDSLSTLHRNRSQELDELRVEYERRISDIENSFQKRSEEFEQITRDLSAANDEILVLRQENCMMKQRFMPDDSESDSALIEATSNDQDIREREVMELRAQLLRAQEKLGEAQEEVELLNRQRERDMVDMVESGRLSSVSRPVHRSFAASHSDSTVFEGFIEQPEFSAQHRDLWDELERVNAELAAYRAENAALKASYSGHDIPIMEGSAISTKPARKRQHSAGTEESCDSAVSSGSANLRQMDTIGGQFELGAGDFRGCDTIGSVKLALNYLSAVLVLHERKVGPSYAIGSDPSSARSESAHDLITANAEHNNIVSYLQNALPFGEILRIREFIEVLCGSMQQMPVTDDRQSGSALTPTRTPAIGRLLQEFTSPDMSLLEFSSVPDWINRTFQASQEVEVLRQKFLDTRDVCQLLHMKLQGSVKFLKELLELLGGLEGLQNFVSQISAIRDSLQETTNLSTELTSYVQEAGQGLSVLQESLSNLSHQQSFLLSSEPRLMPQRLSLLFGSSAEHESQQTHDLPQSVHLSNCKVASDLHLPRVLDRNEDRESKTDSGRATADGQGALQSGENSPPQMQSNLRAIEKELQQCTEHLQAVSSELEHAREMNVQLQADLQQKDLRIADFESCGIEQLSERLANAMNSPQDRERLLRRLSEVPSTAEAGDDQVFDEWLGDYFGALKMQRVIAGYRQEIQTLQHTVTRFAEDRAALQSRVDELTALMQLSAFTLSPDELSQSDHLHSATGGALPSSATRLSAVSVRQGAGAAAFSPPTRAGMSPTQYVTSTTAQSSGGISVDARLVAAEKENAELHRVVQAFMTEQHEADRVRVQLAQMQKDASNHVAMMQQKSDEWSQKEAVLIQEAKDLKSRLTEAEVNVARYCDEIKTLRDDGEAKLRALSDKAAKEQRQLESQITQAKQALRDIQTNQEDAERTRDQLIDQLNQSKAKLAELTRLLEVERQYRTEECKRLEHERLHAVQQLDFAERDAKKAKEQMDQVQVQLQAKENELVDLRTRLKEWSQQAEKVQVAEAELAQIISHQRQRDTEFGQLQWSFTRLEGERNEAAQRLADTEQMLAEALGERDELQMVIAQLKSELEQAADCIEQHVAAEATRSTVMRSVAVCTEPDNDDVQLWKRRYEKLERYAKVKKSELLEARAALNVATASQSMSHAQGESSGVSLSPGKFDEHGPLDQINLLLEDERAKADRLAEINRRLEASNDLLERKIQDVDAERAQLQARILDAHRSVMEKEQLIASLQAFSSAADSTELSQLRGAHKELKRAYANLEQKMLQLLEQQKRSPRPAGVGGSNAAACSPDSSASQSPRGGDSPWPEADKDLQESREQSSRVAISTVDLKLLQESMFSARLLLKRLLPLVAGLTAQSAFTSNTTLTEVQKCCEAMKFHFEKCYYLVKATLHVEVMTEGEKQPHCCETLRLENRTLQRELQKTRQQLADQEKSLQAVMDRLKAKNMLSDEIAKRTQKELGHTMSVIQQAKQSLAHKKNLRYHSTQ